MNWWQLMLKRQKKKKTRGGDSDWKGSLDWASLKEELDFPYSFSSPTPPRENLAHFWRAFIWLTGSGFGNSKELLRTEDALLCWNQRDYGKIFPLKRDLLPAKHQKGLQPGIQTWGGRLVLPSGKKKHNPPKSTDLQQGFLTRGSVNSNENNNAFLFLLSSES